MNSIICAAMSNIITFLTELLIDYYIFDWMYQDSGAFNTKKLTLYTLHPWVSIFNGFIWYTTMSALFFFCRLLLCSTPFTVVLPTSLHILGKCSLRHISHSVSFSVSLSLPHSVLWVTCMVYHKAKSNSSNSIRYCGTRMNESNVTTSEIDIIWYIHRVNATLWN